MPNDYISILVLGIVATVISLVAVFLGHRVGPHRPSVRKAEPYESGMTAIGPAQRRVQVKFYRIAVLFILFDIEVIFMYPWAVLFFDKESGTIADAATFLFIEMLVFMGILLIGYVYAWKSGALEWD